MAKVKKIISIEDSVGKHWDINRTLDWNRYPEAKGQSKGERVILSYNIEKELERNKMSIGDYVKETLRLNPDFERVYCR